MKVVISSALIFTAIYGIVSLSTVVSLVALLFSYLCFIALLFISNLDLIGFIIFFVYVGGILILFFLFFFSFGSHKLEFYGESIRHEFIHANIVFFLFLFIFICACMQYFSWYSIESTLSIIDFLKNAYDTPLFDLVFVDTNITILIKDSYSIDSVISDFNDMIHISSFDYSSIMPLSISLYTVFFFVIGNIGLYFMVVVFSVSILSPTTVRASYKSIFFLSELCILYRGGLTNNKTTFFNLSLWNLHTYDDPVYVFLLVGFIIFFGAFFSILTIHKTVQINFFKFLIFLEFMFLGIMSIIVFFSLYHSDVSGICFIFFLLGLFASETVIGMLLYTKLIE